MLRLIPQKLVLTATFSLVAFSGATTPALAQGLNDFLRIIIQPPTIQQPRMKPSASQITVSQNRVSTAQLAPSRPPPPQPEAGSTQPARTSPPSSQAGSIANGIHNQFQGVWQMILEGRPPRCEGPDLELEIEVTENRVTFPESGCDVVSVEPVGPDNVIAVNLACSGEGGRSLNRDVWTLSEIDGAPILRMEPENSEFTSEYSRCSAPAAAPSYTTDSYCYEDGQASLRITTLNQTQARFEIESAQGGGHICGLDGVGEVIAGGLRYSEAIDGFGECQLDILFSADRRVRFEDPDWSCKQFYCGARAAFEHIKFAGSDGQYC